MQTILCNSLYETQRSCHVTSVLQLTAHYIQLHRLHVITKTKRVTTIVVLELPCLRSMHCYICIRNVDD
jgi:hypothetical protein